MESLERTFSRLLRGRISESFIMIFDDRDLVTGLGNVWQDGLGGGVDAWRGSVKLRDWDQMKEIHGFRFCWKG